MQRQALDAAEAGLAAARRAENSADWAMGLIWRFKIEVPLLANNTETAIDNYRRTPWPDDLLGRLAVISFYVNQLARYSFQYSGFIEQRLGKVQYSPDHVETWTQHQLRREALARIEELWSRRAELAGHREVDISEVYTYDDTLRLPPPDTTLRGMISYLLADQLSQTSWWSKEELQGVGRLDLSRAISAVEATRPGVHPLIRAAAVLDDLARWHRSRGRQEAAHDAYRVKLEILFERQTDEQNRGRLRAELASHAAKVNGQPGWDRVMAARVAFTLSPPSPDLPGALRLARECQQGAPEAPGTAACRHLEQTILAPELSLRTTATSAPGSPVLAVTTRNLETVHLRAYRVRWQNLVAGTGGDTLVTGDWVEAALAQKKPDASWSVSPSQAKAHETGRTLITPPMTALGPYLVLASARADFPRQDNVIQGALLVLTDLVLVRQREPDQVTVTVVSGSTGEPVPGVKIICYRPYPRAPRVAVKTQITDAAGQARFSRLSRNRYYYFTGQKDKDWVFHVDEPFARQSYQRGSVYLVMTDKQAYHPGQRLHYKLLALQVPGRALAPVPLAGHEMSVKLEDGDGIDLGRESLTTNRFGTASGVFKLPAHLFSDELRIRVEGSTEEFPNGSTLRVAAVGPHVKKDRAPAAPERVDDPGAGLTLKVERLSARVGDRVKVIASAGSTQLPLFLSLYQHGALLEQRRLEPQGGEAKVELDITPDHRGGLGLVLWAIRDHQLLTRTATIAVTRNDRRLEIKLESFRRTLKKGEQARWAVKVTQTTPGSSTPRAEVLATLVAANAKACGLERFDPLDLLDRLSLATPPSGTPGQSWPLDVRAAGFKPPPHLHRRFGHLVYLMGKSFQEHPPAYLRGQSFTDGFHFSVPSNRAKQPHRSSIHLPHLPWLATIQERQGAHAIGCHPSRETAIFLPHLVTDEYGVAHIEVKAPAETGRWRLYLHAITHDLVSGTLSKELEVVP